MLQTTNTPNKENNLKCSINRTTYVVDFPLLEKKLILNQYHFLKYFMEHLGMIMNDLSFRYFSVGKLGIFGALDPKNPQKNTAWRRSGNWLKLWAPGSWTNMAPSWPASGMPQWGMGQTWSSYLLKMAIEIVDFPHWTWWFSIAMLVYQRVPILEEFYHTAIPAMTSGTGCQGFDS